MKLHHSPISTLSSVRFTIFLPAVQHSTATKGTIVSQAAEASD